MGSFFVSASYLQNRCFTTSCNVVVSIARIKMPVVNPVAYDAGRHTQPAKIAERQNAGSVVWQTEFAWEPKCRASIIFPLPGFLIVADHPSNELELERGFTVGLATANVRTQMSCLSVGPAGLGQPEPGSASAKHSSRCRINRPKPKGNKFHRPQSPFPEAFA